MKKEEYERIKEVMEKIIQKYKVDKIVGNMAGDYIFIYDLKKGLIEEL